MDGFTAGVYQNYLESGDNRFILGFAGTDPMEIIDIITDLRQGIGLYTEQYAKAIEIGDAVRTAIELTGRIQQVVTTGHSLGSGLASAASLAGDFSSQIFNGAGLHQNTIASIINPASPQIDNYHLEFDWGNW